MIVIWWASRACWSCVPCCSFGMPLASNLQPYTRWRPISFPSFLIPAGSWQSWSRIMAWCSGLRNHSRYLHLRSDGLHEVVVRVHLKSFGWSWPRRRSYGIATEFRDNIHHRCGVVRKERLRQDCLRADMALAPKTFLCPDWRFVAFEAKEARAHKGPHFSTSCWTPPNPGSYPKAIPVPHFWGLPIETPMQNL